jgi:hypothetical protein
MPYSFRIHGSPQEARKLYDLPALFATRHQFRRRHCIESEVSNCAHTFKSLEWLSIPEPRKQEIGATHQKALVNSRTEQVPRRTGATLFDGALAPAPTA